MSSLDGAANPLRQPKTVWALSFETDGRQPVVAAIDGSPKADAVMAAAIEFARAYGTFVDVLHVVETDVIKDQALDPASPDAAHDVIVGCLSRLRAAHVEGEGHLLRVANDHGGAGRRVATFANERHARMIVIGAPADSEIVEMFDASITDELLRHSEFPVHVVAAAPAHDVAVRER